MITAIILLALLATVLYFHVTDTAKKFMYSVTSTGRMILIVVIVLIAVAFMIYSLIKFGTIV